MTEFDPVAYLNEPRWRGMSLGLERIAELLERLGNPQDRFLAVHVAGTNGKGSTSAFIAQILQCAGYKTGLFTSPYITAFEERIQINRTMISRKDLCAVTLKVKHAAEEMSQHPTEFELMTAVAFLYFAQQQCDIAVIEVGLGGRLDSTNVLSQVLVSVVTPIALDHCAVLGNTLSAIAKEKAGIIRPGVPVVSAVQQPEAHQVIEQVALQRGAPLIVANQSLSGTTDDFTYGNWNHMSIALKGCYQLNNAALALEVIQVLSNLDQFVSKNSNEAVLRDDNPAAASAYGECHNAQIDKKDGRGSWHIPNRAVRQGLQEAQWPGRFEIISQNPVIILDGAHNEQGITSLLDSLTYYYPNQPVIFMVGILEDKAHELMVQKLASRGAGFVTIPVPNPRTLSPTSLAREITQALDQQKNSAVVQCAQSICEGVSQALLLVPSGGVICACGSLYSLAQVKQAFQNALGGNLETPLS